MTLSDMDEFILRQLIVAGESESVEFKERLELDLPQVKAEFVKDLVSLSNSATETGYLLIGINKDRIATGIQKIEEERIQQIAKTYINPTPKIRCLMIPLQTPSPVLIGVIAINATARPVKVIRSIDRINQNEVFVRHGSVVEKASPEEILSMYEGSGRDSQTRAHVQAAEKHTVLGNLENAIRAYSAAIDLAPRADLFLARGKLYENALKKSHYMTSLPEAALACKDLTDAINLPHSEDIIIEARVIRWRIRHLIQPQEIRNFADYENDLENELIWLKNNTTGRRLGEVLFSSIRATLYHHGRLEEEWFTTTPSNFIDALNEIIQLGYSEPEVYWARANAHFFDANYGLALRDINRAIGDGKQAVDMMDCLLLRAGILLRMGKFKDAYNDLVAAKFSTGQKFYSQYDCGATLESFDAILWRWSLDQLFDDDHDFSESVLSKSILIEAIRLILLARPHLTKAHPEIGEELKQLVGDRFWSQRNQIQAVKVNWLDKLGNLVD